MNWIQLPNKVDYININQCSCLSIDDETKTIILEHHQIKTKLDFGSDLKSYDYYKNKFIDIMRSG